jgi:hypothetical protein
MAAQTLPDMWDERVPIYADSIRIMDELVGVYLGYLPSQFDDYFHEEMAVHIINMIRLSWDDLASIAGKVFPLYVDPDNDGSKAKKRAEHQERIGYGYNEAGRIVGGLDMQMLMKILAWWMVGAGEAVPMVLPNYECHTPFFTFRDPRTYYPPVGWTPFSQAPADDALFAYPITVGEMKRRWPQASIQIDQTYSKILSGPTRTISTGDSTVVHMGEYYHRDAWIVQPLTESAPILEQSYSDDDGHPGIVPVEPMALYSASHRSRPLFADQVSLQAAMARMFSQKIDYADRSLYPIIFTSPLADKLVRVGPWAINEWDPTFQGQFRADVIGPTNAIDFDQTMAFVTGMQRMLNRNPESFQGQAPGGRADSAKALNSLRDAVVNTTVRDMLWPPMLHALPKLYAKAARLDIKLWPNERKRASGRRKNQAFRMNYRAKPDLDGREDDFQVETGAGLGGYQGTLEILQLVGAELMDEDTALEQLENVREAQEAKRRLQAMRLEKIQRDDLTARALAPPGTPGKLKPDALAKIKQRVLESGEDMFDVIADLDKKGELVEEAPVTPELGGMAGGPAGAPALPPGMPIPPLELIRGGQG